ncbi:MAG: SagB/ThcOx family dehydrogenase [Candidatus Methylomirabilales bacterium]
MNGVGKQFIEQTKYANMGKPDQGRGLLQPPLELDRDRTRKPIPLPAPKTIRLGSLSVREAIDQRRTLRAYSRVPLNLEELSYLLWCTQGVQQIVPGFKTMRTVPSAGARHAFETYLCVNNVSGLTPGLYRFLALDHALIEQDPRSDFADRLAEACLGQETVKTCAATFLWTAVVYRMTYRYGERGYRYLYLDAGHVCQNLYLAAEAIGCGVCALAAFSDDDVNRLLGLDGEERFAIYLGAVGKK